MAIIKLEFNAFSRLTENVVEDVVKDIKKSSFNIITKEFKNKSNQDKITDILRKPFRRELRKEMEERDQVASGKVMKNTAIYFYGVSTSKDKVTFNLNAGVSEIPKKDSYSFYNSDGRPFRSMDAIMEWVKNRIEMGSIKAVASFSAERNSKMSKEELQKRVAFAIYNKERTNPAIQKSKRSNRYIKTIGLVEHESTDYGRKNKYFVEEQKFENIGSLVHDAVMKRVLSNNLSAIIKIISGLAGKELRKYVHTPYFYEKQRKRTELRKLGFRLSGGREYGWKYTRIGG